MRLNLKKSKERNQGFKGRRRKEREGRVVPTEDRATVISDTVSVCVHANKQALALSRKTHRHANQR